MCLWSLRFIMHNLGKAKQINEAFEVYEKMKRNGLVLDAAFYSSLIFILSKSGRIKDAWNVFIDMEKQGFDRDVMTYNAMISSACTHKQEENALKLLRLMEEKECKPNVETYAPLLKLCCKRKRIKVLKFLVDHMDKNNVSIDLGTYALLVRGLCNSGKIELACSFFEEAISKEMLPYDSTYKILVEALEKNNMAESMLKLQKLMVMFPSTLLETGENWTLMKTISVIEYLNYEAGKFSKSKCIGVFGNDAKDTNIPVEVWRYYLLTNRPEQLSNLGNFINRVLSFIAKPSGTGYGGVYGKPYMVSVMASVIFSLGYFF
ncbi:pentatricopeptide repeat-containing protein At3g22670, mitochondrial-like isoform X2 [Euphorbia lathyris]|uniref:pentatricopeptide repeat-containing protein At3g22670, mitochondrial-like isoform X2 n=1 Tax=Euphorbia lathyris TaxID=212925 RepID=UPI00331309FA